MNNNNNTTVISSSENKSVSSRQGKNNKGKYAHLKHNHFPRVLQHSRPSSFDVYTQNGDAVYTINAENILHLPPDYEVHYSKGHNQHNNHRLTLCPHFHRDLCSNNKKNSATCPLGERCSHVHAVHLENASVNREIHFNFAYKNLQDVKYERYALDTPPLRVAPPNETAPVEDLPAHLCIKTKAYIGRDRITSHCAHYYFNRICNRGSECFFVHAVSLEQAKNSTQQHANENKQDEEEQEFVIPSGYRRIYGRTEPPLRSSPTSVKKNNISSKNTSKKEQQQQQQQPRQQSFASTLPFAGVPHFQQPHHQEQYYHQQQERIVESFRRRNSNHSSSSSSIAPSSFSGDDEQENNNNHDDTYINDPYYFNNTNTSSTTTTLIPNSPHRCPCVGCKKFVHNPYSWTMTTVCLSPRISPSY